MTPLLPARFREWCTQSPRLRDGVVAALAGLVARGWVVAWAASRFPPAEDGKYYDVVASRIAHGLGYTWLWPDGAVTYAAHYPVGYPALVGALYAALGRRALWPMLFNAFVGSLAVVAVHRVASTEANRAGALIAASIVAIHPGLVFYTPALMTEGVSAALLALAGWVSVRPLAGDSRGVAFRSLALGAVFAGATLVRPQSLLLAPLYGFVSARTAWRRGAAVAVGTFVVATALCLPWTLRNCSRMKSCVFVSANAGWNLFIGAAPGATGTWVPLDRLGVPPPCRTIWGEAEKDACFATAAVSEIRRAPGRFLALVPSKLAATFDYAGAAGWYLNSSNPAAFGERDKLALGVAETVWERAVVLAGLWALASRGPRRRARQIVTLISAFSVLIRSAWIAHVGVAVAGLLLGRRLGERPGAALAVLTVAGTALTHAVFFGAGRYSLVCFPALAALAGTVLTREERPEDTGDSKE